MHLVIAKRIKIKSGSLQIFVNNEKLISEPLISLLSDVAAEESRALARKRLKKYFHFVWAATIWNRRVRDSLFQDFEY